MIEIIKFLTNLKSHMHKKKYFNIKRAISSEILFHYLIVKTQEIIKAQ